MSELDNVLDELRAKVADRQTEIQTYLDGNKEFCDGKMAEYYKLRVSDKERKWQQYSQSFGECASWLNNRTNGERAKAQQAIQRYEIIPICDYAIQYERFRRYYFQSLRKRKIDKLASALEGVDTNKSEGIDKLIQLLSNSLELSKNSCKTVADMKKMLDLDNCILTNPAVSIRNIIVGYEEEWRRGESKLNKDCFYQNVIKHIEDFSVILAQQADREKVLRQEACNKLVYNYEPDDEEFNEPVLTDLGNSIHRVIDVATAELERRATAQRDAEQEKDGSTYDGDSESTDLTTGWDKPRKQLFNSTATVVAENNLGTGLTGEDE